MDTHQSAGAGDMSLPAAVTVMTVKQTLQTPMTVHSVLEVGVLMEMHWILISLMVCLATQLPCILVGTI